jgi:hypothetical protein
MGGAYVTRGGEKNTYMVLLGYPKERDHFVDLGIEEG